MGPWLRRLHWRRAAAMLGLMATIEFPLVALFGHLHGVTGIAAPVTVWVVAALFGPDRTSDDDLSIERSWKTAVACTIAYAAVGAATTVLAIARLQHAPLLAGFLLADAALISGICVWFYTHARRYRDRCLQAA